MTVDASNLPASVRTRSSRIASIEILRILSAFGIVLFHSRIGNPIVHNLAYGGLVYFIIASVFFQFVSQSRPTKEWFYTLRRIAVPWLFWSVFFLIARMASTPSNAYQGGSLAKFLISGTSLHLWYPPFLMATLALCTVSQRILSRKMIFWSASVLALVITVLSGLWRPWSLSVGTPVAQYAHAVFAVISGVLVAMSILDGRASAIIVALTCSLALINLEGLGFPYLVGIAMFVSAYALKDYIRMSTAITMLADCTFGIYLVHPAFFPVARLFAGNEGILYPILAFTLSLCTVLTARIFGNSTIQLLFGLPTKFVSKAVR